MGDEEDRELWQRQLDEASRRGAERAVKEVFARMGVDSDSPEQLEEFRQALRLASRLQRAFDKGFVVGVATLVGLIGAAVVISWGQRLIPK